MFRFLVFICLLLTTQFAWPASKLASVRLLDGASGTPTHAWDYKYDAVGCPSALVAPNGQTISFAMDAGGRMLERIFGGAASDSALFSNYRWLPEGSLAGITHRSGSTVLGQQDYGYSIWGKSDPSLPRRHSAAHLRP